MAQRARSSASVSTAETRVTASAAARDVGSPLVITKDKWPRAESRPTGGNPPKGGARADTKVGRGPGAAARRRRVDGAILPRHVRECSSNGSKRWAVWSWLKADPTTKMRTPYKCKSWRCHHCTVHRNAEDCRKNPSECRTCARHEAAVTFARIMEAAGPLHASGWCFGVLTLDREGYYSRERPWRDASEAYRDLSAMWRKTAKRWRRWMIKRGFRPFGNEWIMVIEAHQSGWPHANVLVWSPELAAHLREHALKRPDNHAAACRCRDCRESVLLFGSLLEHATACKWGKLSTLEPARSPDALAGYVTKLAAHGEATGGELAKITQAPMQAPERFRRLRAGKGFLPKRRKNEEITGTLVRRYTVADVRAEVASDERVARIQGKDRLAEVIARQRVQLEGEDQSRVVLVKPLFKVSADRVVDVQAACRLEVDYAHEEREREQWNRVALAAAPKAIEFAPRVFRVRDPYRATLAGIASTEEVKV